MRPKSYTLSQEQYICDNAGKFTAKELSDLTDLSTSIIYWIGQQNFLTFKPGRPGREKSTYNTDRKKWIVRDRDPILIPDQPKAKIIRPAAQYDNVRSNYLT